MNNFIAISSFDETIKECEKAMDKKFIRFTGRNKFINNFIKGKRLEMKRIRENFISKVILISFILVCNEN
jgi:hypothetical protein